MTSNIGARQIKDFGQGVGFGTAAKLGPGVDFATYPRSVTFTLGASINL